jgi:hypothetical protein
MALRLFDGMDALYVDSGAQFALLVFENEQIAHKFANSSQFLASMAYKLAKSAMSYGNCYLAAMHFFSKRAFTWAAKTLLRCMTLHTELPDSQKEDSAFGLAQCFTGLMAKLLKDLNNPRYHFARRQVLHWYRKVLEVRPDRSDVVRHLFYIERRDAYWENWDWTVARISTDVTKALAAGRQSKDDPEPITSWWHHHFRMLDPEIYRSLTALQAQMWLAEAANERGAVNASVLTYTDTLLAPLPADAAFVYRQQRLHVAFVSVGSMFSELQAIRNQHATVSCYSIWFPTSDITHACDHFHSLYTMTTLQIAQKINADGINILIDVNVVDTRNPWKVVLAHRPAPVQVVYQHDDTSGLSYIDHRFTSLAHMPPEYQSWYSEKLVYLCCAWVDEDVTKVRSVAVRCSSPCMPNTPRAGSGGPPLRAKGRRECANGLRPVLAGIWMYRLRCSRDGSVRIIAAYASQVRGGDAARERCAVGMCAGV